MDGFNNVLCCRFDRVRGAKVSRERQGRRTQIYRNDWIALRQRCALGNVKSDATGTDNDNAVARLNTSRSVDGADTSHYRTSNRREHCKRNVWRNRDCALLGNDGVIGETCSAIEVVHVLATCSKSCAAAGKSIAVGRLQQTVTKNGP